MTCLEPILAMNSLDQYLNRIAWYEFNCSRFTFLINPILQWIMPDAGTPELPTDVMMELTLALLGLASLRTVEKIKGVAK